MCFVRVTFDPRHDQLEHRDTLIGLISELFVELCVAYPLSVSNLPGAAGIEWQIVPMPCEHREWLLPRKHVP